MKFKWMLIIICGVLLMPALAIGDSYEGSVQASPASPRERFVLLVEKTP